MELLYLLPSEEENNLFFVLLVKPWGLCVGRASFHSSEAVLILCPDAFV